MKKFFSLAVVLVLGCPGCGDPEEGHVWKDQTDMIDKAGEVENMLLDQGQQQRRQIDEMAR
jgi:hypothetical protein